MPWSSNEELPRGVKSLPQEAQTVWRHIANSALEQYTDETKALATAWAGVKRAGWSKDTEGKWTQVEKEESYIFDIQKADPEKRLAFGWAVISRDRFGQEIFDLQNDGIDPEELEALAYRYVRFYRDSGELHINSGKAICIESMVSTLEKQAIWNVPANHMPVGWWVGFYITDNKVWERVKDGTYKAFSIQGLSIRQEAP